MPSPLACNWAGVLPAATPQFDADLKVDLVATQAVQAALVREGGNPAPQHNIVALKEAAPGLRREEVTRMVRRAAETRP